MNEDVFYRTLGAKIRQFREKLGMTQEQVAELMDLSRPTITYIENGNQRVLAHQLIQFGYLFNIEPSMLLL